jgi:hypothetical protein
MNYVIDNLNFKELYCLSNSYVISKEAAIYIVNKLAKHLEYRVYLIRKKANFDAIDFNSILLRSFY